jgi:hypothetical protein
MFAPVGDASPKRVTRMLRSDMTRSHEARPHGVPTSYDWANGPRPRRGKGPLGYTAFTAWGQLYRCSRSRFDSRETIELRDLQTWLLIGKRWRLAQPPSMLGGSAYPESYMGSPTSAPVSVRNRMRTDVRLLRGYNFHFWPRDGRIAYNRSAVQAIAVVARARITGTRRDAGCVVLSVGGDYWRTLTGSAAAGRPQDAGVGRFKRVRHTWRAFSMTTATATTLDRRPLPLHIRAPELR